MNNHDSNVGNDNSDADNVGVEANAVGGASAVGGAGGASSGANAVGDVESPKVSGRIEELERQLSQVLELLEKQTAQNEAKTDSVTEPDQSSATPTAESAPAESAPTESVPADTEPAESAPATTESAEAVLAPTAPTAEAAPADTEPAEGTGVDDVRADIVEPLAVPPPPVAGTRKHIPPPPAGYIREPKPGSHSARSEARSHTTPGARTPVAAVPYSDTAVRVPKGTKMVHGPDGAIYDVPKYKVNKQSSLSMSLPTLEASLRWVGLALVCLAFSFAVASLISQGYLGPRGQVLLVTLLGAAFMAGGLRLRSERRIWALSLIGVGTAALTFLSYSDLLANTFTSGSGLALCAIAFGATSWLAKSLRSSGLAMFNTAISALAGASNINRTMYDIAELRAELSVGEDLARSAYVIPVIATVILVAVIAFSYYQTRFYNESGLYSATNIASAAAPLWFTYHESPVITGSVFALGLTALTGAALLARAHTPDQLDIDDSITRSRFADQNEPVGHLADGTPGADGETSDTSVHDQKRKVDQKRRFVAISSFVLAPAFAFFATNHTSMKPSTQALVSLIFAVAATGGAFWVSQKAKSLNTWSIGLGAYLTYVYAVSVLFTDKEILVALIAMQTPVLLLISWWHKGREGLVHTAWFFAAPIWLYYCLSFLLSASNDLSLSEGVSYTLITLSITAFGYIAWVEQFRDSPLPFLATFRNRYTTGLFPGSKPAAQTPPDSIEIADLEGSDDAGTGEGDIGHTVGALSVGAQSSTQSNRGQWLVIALTTFGLLWIRRMFMPLDHGNTITSVIWALLAFTFFAFGVRTKDRGLATIGLAILVVTLTKLIIFDLAFLGYTSRAIVFGLVGAGMLRMAFILPKLEFKKALTAPIPDSHKGSVEQHFHRLDTEIPQSALRDTDRGDSQDTADSTESTDIADSGDGHGFDSSQVQWPTAPPESKD